MEIQETAFLPVFRWMGDDAARIVISQTFSPLLKALFQCPSVLRMAGKAMDKYDADRYVNDMMMLVS